MKEVAKLIQLHGVTSEVHRLGLGLGLERGNALAVLFSSGL